MNATISTPDATDSPAAPSATPRYSKAYLRYVLFMLMVMNTLAFIDRAVINVLAQPIKEDLGLTDGQVGILAGLAFMIVYTISALPLARLAERTNRVNLIAACMVVWSVATAAGGLATNYLQLLLSRVGVGAGESGATPTAHSVIGDYFPPDKRGSAVSYFVFGLPLGIMLGSIIGGYAAQLFTWRGALMVVGLPGVALALLVKFTIKEPIRGAADHADTMKGDTPSFVAVLKHLLARASFLHLTAAFTIAAFASGGMYVFLPAILIRRFGLSVGDSGLIYGMLGGACAAVGVLIGGYLTDLLVKRDRRWFVWLPGFNFIIAIPLIVIALFQADWRILTGLLIIPFILKSAYLPSSLAAYHNMVEPRMRATTITIVFLLSNVVGAGGGPYFAGALSDLFAYGSFFGSYDAVCGTGQITYNLCASREAYSITVGVAAASMLGLWAMVHFFLAARSIRDDFVT